MSDNIIVPRRTMENWSTTIARVWWELQAGREAAPADLRDLIEAVAEMKRLRHDQAIERG